MGVGVRAGRHVVELRGRGRCCSSVAERAVRSVEGRLCGRRRVTLYVRVHSPAWEARAGTPKLRRMRGAALARWASYRRDVWQLAQFERREALTGESPPVSRCWSRYQLYRWAFFT